MDSLFIYDTIGFLSEIQIEKLRIKHTVKILGRGYLISIFKELDMKKKVLILGGSGFIGYGIAKLLSENISNAITIADILPDEHKDKDLQNLLSNSNISMIEGDFTNPKMFDKLEKDYDFIYMLASVVGVNRCIEEPHEVLRINTLLIQNTLDWLISCKSGKVIFSSSSECYAATTEKLNFEIPTAEDVPLAIEQIGHPRFTYAVTKIFGESAFLNYSKVYNFPLTIVRYQNIFGPRMGFKHVIPHLVERFLQDQEEFKIYGAHQTRAFCYLSDAAKGTVLAMESSSSNQEVFHIGSDKEITIEELTTYVGEIMNYNGRYTNAETYPGSVSRRCPDITKARNILNYNPVVNWKDGVKKTVLWYVNYFKSGNKNHSGGFQPAR